MVRPGVILTLQFRQADSKGSNFSDYLSYLNREEAVKTHDSTFGSYHD